MAAVLKYDVVVLDGLTPKTLPRGSVVPKKYADQVTNPRAYIESDEPVRAPKAEVQPVTAGAAASGAGAAASEEPVKVDYSKLKSAELKVLVGARGLAEGNVKQMQAALVKDDEEKVAAAAAATSESDSGGNVDLSTLDEAGLREYASENGIDISEATSEEEIRAIVENAAGE